MSMEEERMEKCWECDEEEFPEPQSEDERWECSCGQRYSACRTREGDIVWEYAEDDIPSRY